MQTFFDIVIGAQAAAIIIVLALTVRAAAREKAARLRKDTEIPWEHAP